MVDILSEFGTKVEAQNGSISRKYFDLETCGLSRIKYHLEKKEEKPVELTVTRSGGIFFRNYSQ